MSGSGARVLLKLLSGPNAGAEMELGPGDWMLGADDASHLLIVDAGVTARHLLLHIEDSGELTVLPKNGTALVAGAPLPPEGMAIPPFMVFTVGGTHMVHGPADGEWPELAAPALVDVNRSEASGGAPLAPGGQQGTPSGDSSGNPSANPSGNPASASSLSGAANSVGGNAAAAKKVGGSGLRRAALFAGLAVLVLTLVLDYTHLGLFFSDAARDAANLTRSLHRRGFSGVTASARPGGGFLVSGAVPGNATMDALVHYVERTGKNVDMSIISLEDLVAGLTARARRLDAPLRVTRTGFMVRVNGYAFDMLALEDVLVEEREALAAVPVRVDVVTWDKAERDVRGMIAARNLDGKVRAVPDLYRVILLSRPLSGPEQQALRSLIRECDDLFGVEGVMQVERWRQVVNEAPRAPSPAVIMMLAPTDPTAQPRPVALVPARSGTKPPAAADGTGETNPAKAPNPAGEANPAKAPNPAGATNVKTVAARTEPGQGAVSAPREGAWGAAFPPLAQDFGLPVLAAQPDFSCSQIRIEGAGHDMAVIYGEVRYRTGAKLPDGMQIRLITPAYVVLQRGKIYTRLCMAGETAKEMRP